MQAAVPDYAPVVAFKNIIENEIQNALNAIKFRVILNDEVADVTSMNSTVNPFIPRKTILTPAPSFGWMFDQYIYLDIPEILLSQEMVCYEKNKTAWNSMYDNIRFNQTWGDDWGFYDNSTNSTVAPPEKCDFQNKSSF